MFTEGGGVRGCRRRARSGTSSVSTRWSRRAAWPTALIPSHGVLACAERPRVVVGRADQVDPPAVALGLQPLEMLLPRDEVVDLLELDALVDQLGLGGALGGLGVGNLVQDLLGDVLGTVNDLFASLDLGISIQWPELQIGGEVARMTPLRISLFDSTLRRDTFGPIVGELAPLRQLLINGDPDGGFPGLQELGRQVDALTGADAEPRSSLALRGGGPVRRARPRGTLPSPRRAWLFAPCCASGASRSWQIL